MNISFLFDIIAYIVLEINFSLFKRLTDGKVLFIFRNHLTKNYSKSFVHNSKDEGASLIKKNSCNPLKYESKHK